MLHVDLGVMIAVGVPVGILSLLFGGILWSKFIGSRIDTGLPLSIQEVREAEEAKLPKFSTVLCIILVPLVLILCNTISEYIPGIDAVRPALEFLGTPFVALIIAVLCAMYFLGKKQGYDGEQLKKISGKHRQNVVPGDLSFSHQNISVLNRSCSSAVQNAVRTVRTITLLYTFDITMDRLFLYNFILFPHTTHIE